MKYMERLAQFEDCAGIQENNMCKKGYILIDIPDTCFECPMMNGSDECILQDEDTNAFYHDSYSGLQTGCPIHEININIYDWKQQALKHAAKAGEMKIAIAQKLEAVRADIVEIRHLLITEDTALDQAILCWKKGQLEKWAIFLEDLLSGGVKKSVGKDWKQNVMQRFGRVE